MRILCLMPEVVNAFVPRVVGAVDREELRDEGEKSSGGQGVKAGAGGRLTW